MEPAFGVRDPDARGYYGRFGGRFVPETLVAPVEALEAAYKEARQDPAFRAELARLLRDFVGRPTPLYEARRLSAALGGARIFLKREDLTHTGAHKINNALGQALLARRMGKRASSPRPARGSTASRRPRPARCSASSATSTWAPRTWSARR
jgi:tryptophan synthase beta chain